MVSVLIPPYCEEKVIEATLEGALGIDYPNFEVVVVDDGSVDETVARITPYVESGRVRLIRKTLVSKIQLIEFTSIVGILRRAQRVWGRIQTVSGVVFAFRKKAVFDVGMFDPSMATEDIDMSWRLQKRFWDIRYEPRGLVWMQVPETLRAFFKQRKRWAVGLGQVLRKHLGILLHRQNLRQWPG